MAKRPPEVPEHQDASKGKERLANPDEALDAYMWDHLPSVRQVQLHDIAGGYSHQIVGTGTVDFMRFLPRLGEASVLEYCIEVRPRERAAESLGNLRGFVRSRTPE